MSLKYTCPGCWTPMKHLAQIQWDTVFDCAEGTPWWCVVLRSRMLFLGKNGVRYGGVLGAIWTRMLNSALCFATGAETTI